MKNILFIAYEFPPLNRGGVFRPLAFVKYLPQFGYHPIVITLSKESYQNACAENLQLDYTIGAEVVKSTVIEEVASDLVPSNRKGKISLFLSTFFSIHGYEGDGWEKDFVIRIEAIIKKYSPVAIVATIPPFGILPLVTSISNQYHLPLILDFRDAWSQWRTTPYATYLHYVLTLNFERKYLNSSSAVIVTSLQTKNDFLRLHNKISEARIHYIPNGIDGERDNWKGIDLGKDEFTIGYVGSFYFDPLARKQMLDPWWKKKFHRMLQYMPDRQDWLYRTPFFFFKTLQILFKKNPGLRGRIKVRFAGKVAPWLNKMVEDFQLQDIVELIGVISHKESIAFQRKCDMLLITSSKRIGGADYSIAGKTFEYFKMQKPVLAFVCEGSQKEILEQSGMALICDPDKPEENANKLQSMIEGKILLHPDITFLDELTREKLTQKLAKVIDAILD